VNKPQLLLHIGTFKTGTTALQDALAGQSPTLMNNGVLYHGWKDDGLNRNHSFLAALLVNESGRAPVARFFADLARECQKLGANKAVVSAEGFYALEFVDDTNWKVKPPLEPEAFQRSRKEYIERLRDCIGGGFDTKVVVYLRRQDYFLNSLHNQLVKDVFGYTGTMEEFAKDWGVLADYGLMLDLWAEAFGAKALAVKIYETQRSPDIVPGFFADMLGLPAPAADTHSAPRSSRGNHALPPDLLEYKRILNRMFGGLDFEEKRKLRDALMRLAGGEDRGSKMLMPAAERRALLARYEKSDRRVAERYLGSTGPLFKEPPPQPDASRGALPGLSVEKAVEIGVNLSLLERRHPRAAADPAKETGWQRWRRDWFRRRDASQPEKPV
jgi:hypothetical protein